MADAPDQDTAQPVELETDPGRYRHIRLETAGPVAHIVLDVQEEGGHRPGYALKLNSYDISVDVELADAVNRLRFEHPEVAAVVVTSAQDGTFCAGANIFMLGTSSHAFKVNFCKYTNETRLAIEEATAASGQTYIAALNGLASGGGYELALACQEIYLVDDRRSAVSFPELPLLGVLPGTGGLTRVVDKRKVRRDRADLFSTRAEGVKGKQAVTWGLVDAVFPPSRFGEEVEARARAVAGEGHPDRRGVRLDPLSPEVTEEGLRYRHVELTFGPWPRTARLTVHGPDEVAELPQDPVDLGAGWWPLRAFRELDDALLRLRFHYPEVGLITLHTRGDLSRVLAQDSQLEEAARRGWFGAEVIRATGSTLRRLEATARSFFAVVDEGSCFGGSLLELALAADRSYMLDSDGVEVATSPLNAGPLLTSNGLTRLQARFLDQPEPVAACLAREGLIPGAEAEELGLVTALVDELDWEDEIRLACEERTSFSPDALTGMEANLRVVGPETLETRILGRLSAWQNWIFQRPNAVGARGALSLYGRPESPQFDWKRT